MGPDVQVGPVRWKRLLYDVLTIGAAAALLLVTIRLIVGQSHPPGTTEEIRHIEIPPEPMDLGTAFVAGRTTAETVLIEFTDYQCPYCGIFARETEPQLLRDLVDKGRLNFVIRNLPTSRAHPMAPDAARAAECTRTTGRFLQYHAAIFQNQAKLTHAVLLDLAASLGIDRDALERCVETEGARRIQEDLIAAGSAAVRATPTFFLGTKQPDGLVKIGAGFSGAVDYPHLVAELDRFWASAPPAIGEQRK